MTCQIGNRRLSHVRLWGLPVLWSLCLLILAWCLGSVAAQETRVPTSRATYLETQKSNDPFILGRQFPVNVYNPSEVVQWAFDFVISPSSAKDRVVLYSYEIQRTDAIFLHRLESSILEKSPLLAIISSSASDLTEREKGGERKTDFAVPIILDSQNKSFVGDFISMLADPAKSIRLVSAVMAVSALKSQGIGGVTPQRTSLERPWSGLIASSIPIYEGPKPLLYIALKSYWDVSKNSPQTMATKAAYPVDSGDGHSGSRSRFEGR